MHHFFFASEKFHFPEAASPEHAELGFELWRERARQSGDGEIAAFAEAAATDPVARRLLGAIFGNSPFLTQAAVQDLGFMRTLLTKGPDRSVAGVMAETKEARSPSVEPATLAPLLRNAKRRLALAVAVADIAGCWPLERVTGALSDFADAALGCAAACLLREAAERGTLSLAHPENPEKGSGLIILGMGKLGGRELNYSSDIDLIVLYDPERMRARDAGALQNDVVRLTRDLVLMMEQRTRDGYVFRTDLRLRPDPGATPIAISLLAAESYYESLGQNWERAAMIKARPVAGDQEAGAAFLDWLTPFIWRKNLDFAAIQDIHSIKRQINAHRGGRAIALKGQNIKLGHGGIREIEFFAQTQQLIWGGRQPELRVAATVEALLALARAGLITQQTADELIAAYRFLRRVEHRLQMIDDEQTQTLPNDDEGLRRLAVFLGYPNGEAFGKDLLAHLRRVEAHYARLFEDAPALTPRGEEAGNLVFTGAEADPDTLETLRRMGFANPKAVDATVRGWHHGRYRATRSVRSRELLTELMPALLQALAKTAKPDDAFLKFDEFLSKLPAGVQLFSMFHSYPGLLDLVAEIMGGAPRLAEILSRRPSLLDSVLTAGVFEAWPSRDELAGELEKSLSLARDYEDVLDRSRRWANERKFQVGVRLLRNLTTAREATRALSDIAETAINGLLPHVAADFARHHGRVPGAAIAIVALGKLGSRELTPASDLDLIFIYTAPPGVDGSDGPKPLSTSHYYARFSQRLINAITALTAEGRLYEVDMRLRPSGKAGPIASGFDAFAHYQRRSAWTWEHMALTRARPISGPPDLKRAVAEVIGEVLARPRDPARLVADVADMRARMDAEFHTENIWEVKHLRGGLVDIEFIAQYLQLREAHEHPHILSPNTRDALSRLAEAGLLERSVAHDLIAALDLWQAIQTMLRLTTETAFTKEREAEIVPRGLQQALCAACGAPDFTALKESIVTAAANVRRHFATLIEEPAKASAPAAESENQRGGG